MQAEGYVYCTEWLNWRDRGRLLTAGRLLQINLKNTWAKAIDTLKAKNTGGSDLSNFVVCYPESIASRIAVLKVRKQQTNTSTQQQQLLCLGQPSNSSGS